MTLIYVFIKISYAYIQIITGLQAEPHNRITPLGCECAQFSAGSRADQPPLLASKLLKGRNLSACFSESPIPQSPAYCRWHLSHLLALISGYLLAGPHEGLPSLPRHATPSPSAPPAQHVLCQEQPDSAIWRRHIQGSSQRSDTGQACKDLTRGVTPLLSGECSNRGVSNEVPRKGVCGTVGAPCTDLRFMSTAVLPSRPPRPLYTHRGIYRRSLQPFLTGVEGGREGSLERSLKSVTKGQPRELRYKHPGEYSYQNSTKAGHLGGSVG